MGVTMLFTLYDTEIGLTLVLRGKKLKQWHKTKCDENVKTFSLSGGCLLLPSLLLKKDTRVQRVHLWLEKS